jgi:hypothetical protein
MFSCLHLVLLPVCYQDAATIANIFPFNLPLILLCLIPCTILWLLPALSTPLFIQLRLITTAAPLIPAPILMPSCLHLKWTVLCPYHTTNLDPTLIKTHLFHMLLTKTLSAPATSHIRKLCPASRLCGISWTSHSKSIHLHTIYIKLTYFISICYELLTSSFKDTLSEILYRLTLTSVVSSSSPDPPGHL